MKPEALLKANMVAKLRETFPRAYIFRPVQVGMGESTVDILCCLNGRFVGIEAKTPGQRPTPRQNFVLSGIQQADGIGFWSDSVAHMMSVLEAHRL